MPGPLPAQVCAHHRAAHQAARPGRPQAPAGEGVGGRVACPILPYLSMQAGLGLSIPLDEWRLPDAWCLRSSHSCRRCSCRMQPNRRAIRAAQVLMAAVALRRTKEHQVRAVHHPHHSREARACSWCGASAGSRRHRAGPPPAAPSLPARRCAGGRPAAGGAALQDSAHSRRGAGPRVAREIRALAGGRRAAPSPPGVAEPQRAVSAARRRSRHACHLRAALHSCCVAPAPQAVSLPAMQGGASFKSTSSRAPCCRTTQR